MGNYVKGQPSDTPYNQINVTSTTIDVAALANAVANAIGHIVIPSGGEIGVQNKIPKIDEFDSKKSMEKLAEAMTVQRSKSESNFDDLGGTVETRKDQNVLRKTLDLLKGLED